MNFENLSTRERALCMMLRPIIRFWIRGSEKMHRFVDLAKVLFVEIAVDELTAKGEKLYDNRISLMSGVHRADVSRIRKEQTTPERNVPNIVTRVVGIWSTLPEYLTKSGKPRVLDADGPDSEFAQLVATVSKSIRASSVEYELVRCGTVEKTARGLKLTEDIHRHTKDYDRAMNLLSRDIATLVKTVEENAASEGKSPNLHVRTEYDQVFVEDIPKIRSWLSAEGKKLHKRAREIIAQSDNDLNENPKKTPGARVVLGTFSLLELPQLNDESAEEETI